MGNPLYEEFQIYQHTITESEILCWSVHSSVYCVLNAPLTTSATIFNIVIIHSRR